ncbi:hypothetical protein ACFVP3_37680 [Streptomyces sp. NPDC057806]|uniref:hypothetical protein n=1 Tax=Streptomyces sp. NPDC057806 TaxID=3346255 RepID=UPI00367988EA
MLTPTREILGLRTLALLPPILFTPSLVSFAVAPGTVGVEYTGILFHLAIMFVVARLPAPEWARAAGYGWLTLDVLSAVLTINELPHDIAWAVRLGGHVPAGMWFVTTSLLAAPRSIRVTGVVLGSWLALYSLLGNVLSEEFLYPGGLLVPVWFILLAWKHDALRADVATAGARPA